LYDTEKKKLATILVRGNKVRFKNGREFIVSNKINVEEEIEIWSFPAETTTINSGKIK